MLAVSNTAHGHTDALGNIARLVYYQIGLRCNIGDSAQVVQRKIEILASRESFKRKTAILKYKIDEDQISFYKLDVFQPFDILK